MSFCRTVFVPGDVAFFATVVTLVATRARSCCRSAGLFLPLDCVYRARGSRGRRDLGSCFQYGFTRYCNLRDSLECGDVTGRLGEYLPPCCAVGQTTQELIAQSAIVVGAEVTLDGSSFQPIHEIFDRLLVLLSTLVEQVRSSLRRHFELVIILQKSDQLVVSLCSR